MADTAEEARRHARTMREIKLYGVADAMDNYAALLEAQPELLRRLRAAEADASKIDLLEVYMVDGNPRFAVRDAAGGPNYFETARAAIDASRRKT